MHEPSDANPGLTAAAADMIRVFHALPQRLPPALVRDLTLGQMGLLFRLHREGPMTMGRIAELFDMSTTASSGFVGRVERHGLVERQHGTSDRRVVECHLTESGTRLVEEISGVRMDLMRRALATLDERELATFVELIGAINDRLGRMEQPT